MAVFPQYPIEPPQGMLHRVWPYLCHLNDGLQEDLDLRACCVGVEPVATRVSIPIKSNQPGTSHLSRAETTIRVNFPRRGNSKAPGAKQENLVWRRSRASKHSRCWSFGSDA